MSGGDALAVYYIERLKEAGMEYRGNVNKDAQALGLMLRVMTEHDIRQLIEFYFDHYEPSQNAGWFAYNYDSIQDEISARITDISEIERLKEQTRKTMRGES